MTNKDAIFYLKQVREDYEGKEFVEGKEAIELAIKALEERPQGEWIKVKPFLHKCSVCGRKLKDVFDDELASDYPFCHCGAAMGG